MPIGKIKKITLKNEQEPRYAEINRQHNEEIASHSGAPETQKSLT